MKLNKIFLGLAIFLLAQNVLGQNLTENRASWIYKIPIDVRSPETEIKSYNSAFNLANMNSFYFINPDKANHIQPAIVDNYVESNNFYAVDIKYDRLIAGMLLEMQYMRKELCRLNNTYGFCVEALTANKIVNEKTNNIIYSPDYLNLISK